MGAARARRSYPRDGELIYSRAGASENRLEPVGEQLFRMLDIDEAALVEFAQENGRYVMAYIDARGEKTVMPSFDYDEPDATSLQAYTGTYHSPELGISLDLLLEEEALVARHPRHPDQSLLLLREDRFSMGELRAVPATRAPNPRERVTGDRCIHAVYVNYPCSMALSRKGALAPAGDFL